MIYNDKLEYAFEKTKPLTKYFPSGETLQSWLDCLKTSEKFISRSRVPAQGEFILIFFQTPAEFLYRFNFMRDGLFLLKG